MCSSDLSGTLRLRDTVALAGREKLKITEMRIPSKGEIVRTSLIEANASHFLTHTVHKVKESVRSTEIKWQQIIMRQS